MNEPACQALEEADQQKKRRTSGLMSDVLVSFSVLDPPQAPVL